MAHDPSNPFQRMAKTLADRQRDKEQSSAPGVPLPAGKEKSRSPGAKAAVSGRNSSALSGDDSEDTDLFLEAMSAAQPLRNASRKDDSASSDRRPKPSSKAPRPSGPGRSSGPAPAASEAGAPAAGTAAFPAQTLAERLRERQEAPPRPDKLAPGNDPAVPPAGKSGPEPLPANDLQAMRSAFDSAGLRANGQPNRSGGEEDLLFAKAMQGVAPVTTKGRDVPMPATGNGKPAPPVDPAKALRDLLEGRLEFALYHSDEFMEGHVVGIDPMIPVRLRAGQFSPEANLDLHGQNAEQAHTSLTWFIKNAYQRSLRTVLVVTGRGKNSPDGVGVLRPLLQRWLSKDPFKRVVLAFCTAKSGDGGPGAVYVLLRKYKKSRGKIVWEYSPSDDDFPDI